ncbi:hypothetical protein ACQPZF_03310 [Actinosynnema sp. CS-041913]|uniref:hypothetical protein n=1 Tax=Actinosynnema sp. CS-041913 TaxID=3239917 RepID=UPI003D933454
MSTRIRHVWEAVTTALALLTGIYLILTTIEPTRVVLERYVGKLDQQGLVALVAVMLEVATIAVYQLGREVRSLRAAVTTRAGEDVTHSIADVLAAARWDAVGRRRRRVEVLGLTLNTTWPMLATWLTSHDRPTGWHLTLYCLDPAFVERSGELPAEWSGEARRSQERIRSFLDEEGDELRRRGITVELKAYACVPIAHGFRFGDGTVFLSYLQWTDNGRIRPFEFYDRVAPDDTSPRAGHYRDLYDSWLARAEAKVVHGTPAA